MRFLDYIMDTSKLEGKNPYRRLLRYFFLFFAIAALLSVLLVFGSEKAPFLVIFFGLSFGATLAMVCIMMVLYAIVWSAYMILHHRELWIRSMFRSSVREGIQVSRQIGALQDPFLDRIFMWWNKVGMFLVKIWLVVYVLVVVGYIVWACFWPHA
ncbi:MAG: hypothetical protein JW720_01150 [Sedimentisphaerales bacterium]|nr:hypothetical protein [Sedimentisphaerales bacterium]